MCGSSSELLQCVGDSSSEFLHGGLTAVSRLLAPFFLGQILEEPIDPSKMLEHDVPVDVIVTPTQVTSAGRDPTPRTCI